MHPTTEWGPCNGCVGREHVEIGMCWAGSFDWNRETKPEYDFFF